MSGDAQRPGAASGRGGPGLPAAVVVAGALVGIGVFFGLRARPAPDPRGVPDAVGARAPVASAIVSGAPAPPPSAPGEPATAPSMPLRLAPDDQAALDREVGRAIGERRGEIARACFAPDAERAPGPASVRFAVRALFDAAGKELYASVAEVGDARRPAVTECVRARRLGLTVTGRGANVAGMATLELP